jgi:hypothetical protein
MISATDLGDDLGDDLGRLVWHSGYPNFRGDIARRHNILKVVSMATTTMFRLCFIVIEPDRGDCGVARFHQPCVSRARRLGIGVAGHHQHRSGRAGTVIAAWLEAFRRLGYCVLEPSGPGLAKSEGDADPRPPQKRR